MATILDFVRAQDRVEYRRELIGGEAYAGLVGEFTAALLFNPAAKVPTPRWADAAPGRGEYEATVVDIVADAACGDDEPLRELLGVVAQAARGEDAALRALACISSLAKRYAAHHVDAWADRLLDDEDQS